MKLGSLNFSFYFIFLVVFGVTTHRVIAGAEITSDSLSKSIVSQLNSVEEFKFITKEANKLGIRVWLFGGTAAAYAHYVKQDLQRQNGIKNYQEEYFDYNFSNIYRSTQDADLVINGSEEQAIQLEMALKRKFPHLVGSKKSAWEVRLLTKPRGDKEALVNNPDFTNQHTDSHSTGMIELTTPVKNEPAIRDLRDWKSSKPNFLKDVLEHKLHYYYSPNHTNTKRYQEGLNPEIFSAVRYLTKAFQFELELRTEDLEKIKEVIRDFDPDRDLSNYRALSWLEKNATKLVANSVDVEYAINTLDSLSLRKKLVAISQPKTKGSMGWWLNKAPLKTKTVGLGKGRTAKDLGLTEVAHETSDSLALESITRSHEGKPNLFISRKDVVGESAWGPAEGFYTAVGKKGARGTGLTIRFKVNPEAREGTDFVLSAPGSQVREGSHVIWINKAAIQVIPESLNVDVPTYFKMLADGFFNAEEDKGLAYKQFKRATKHAFNLTKKDEAEIMDIVRPVLSKKSPKTNKRVIDEEDDYDDDEDRKIDNTKELFYRWLAFPLSRQHEELTKLGWDNIDWQTDDLLELLGVVNDMGEIPDKHRDFIRKTVFKKFPVKDLVEEYNLLKLKGIFDSPIFLIKTKHGYEIPVTLLKKYNITDRLFNSEELPEGPAGEKIIQVRERRRALYSKKEKPTLHGRRIIRVFRGLSPVPSPVKHLPIDRLLAHILDNDERIAAIEAAFEKVPDKEGWLISQVEGSPGMSEISALNYLRAISSSSVLTNTEKNALYATAASVSIDLHELMMNKSMPLSDWLKMVAHFAPESMDFGTIEEKVVTTTGKSRAKKASGSSSLSGFLEKLSKKKKSLKKDCTELMQGVGSVQ